MSNWDFVMPHRLLINRSLRIEADRMRTKLDYYTNKLEREKAKADEEIKETEEWTIKHFEEFQDTLVQAIEKDRELIQKIQVDFIEYADLFLSRKCLYQKRKLKEKQVAIFNEEEEFLSAQMSLIADDIELLRDRQNELSAFIDVKDVIQLSIESGGGLGIRADDDAKHLLEIVKKEIAACNQNQELERFALLRLKDIVQERSDYRPVIKLISWIVQQKIRYSKQLSLERSNVQLERKEVEASIMDINEGIRIINRELWDLSKKIQACWETPILELSNEIDYQYRKIDDIKEQQEEIKEGQQRMKRWNEYDSDKMHRYNSDWESLSMDYSSVKSSISYLKAQRKEWYERRNNVMEICKKYGIRFEIERNGKRPRRSIDESKN